MTSLNRIANISNTVPILQQERSQIVTNPFIPKEQKVIELQELDKQANSIIEQQFNQNKTSSIANMTLKQINTNMASSILGFFNDLFTKPSDIPWGTYIPTILEKDQRYAYFGILFIIIAIYMLITKKN